MKLFPKLAGRTNLTADELKVYYSIRFAYILPYNEKVRNHEQSLLSLAMAMLRAGKIKFELHPEGHSDGASEEESKVGLSQIGIQFSHESSSVTVDQENEVMEQLKRGKLKHSFWKNFGF